jgi:microcystin-dependent protein
VADPQTVNIGLFVPNTGADVDTWGAVALNPDFVAIDGLIGGVQTIAVTNAPITLTAPAAFTATPTPGPTQAQNRVLRFTGTLTANVRATLPLPGAYLIDNRTTGAFVLSFQGVTATEVIATEQGSVVEIYNDGANVRFVGLGRVGALEHWAGVSVLPAWVTACTVPPFLLADGTVYNFSSFPWLGAKFLATFGGNGSTTFGTPDLRGRVPLAYDGTGARITVAGCGLNGQTLGAFLDAQTITLTTAQMPSHFHAAGISDPGHTHGTNALTGSTTTGGGGFPAGATNGATVNANTTGVRVSSSNGLDTTYSAGGGAAHGNVQPSQVTGVWVVKT